MKINWKNAGKSGINSLVDIGAATAGAIASNQFLDLQKMFPNMPSENFVIKHQGGIKAGAAALAIALFDKKMPQWAKMALIGVGVAGAAKEARVLMGEDKISSIGNNGSDTSVLDDLLKDAAKGNYLNGAYDAGSGVGSYDAGAGVGSYDAGAGVGNSPLSTAIPIMNYDSRVGWMR